MKNTYGILLVILLSFTNIASIKAYDKTNEIYIIDDFEQTQEAYMKLDEIIIYCNQQGIEDVFLDVGYIQGKHINEYLSRGDEDLLKEIMNELYPEYRTEEFKNTLIKIHQYNKKNNKMIQVVGIGRDRKENTLKGLNTLLKPYLNNYKTIEEDLAEINNLPGLKVFEKFQSKVNAYDSIYGDILEGEDWLEIQLILGSAFENTQDKYNDKVLYNQYKDKPILIISDKEDISFDYSNAKIITFEYKDSEKINWSTGKKENFKDDSRYMNGEQVISVVNSSAATIYGYNEEKAQEYIKQHTTSINPKNTGFSGLEPLKKSPKNTRLYLAGENHGNTGTYEMQEYLIKFFHEEMGINKMLFECSYAMGEMMNDYIQTGNELLLRRIIEEFSNSFFYSQEFEQMLRNLYTYNKGQANKIQIIGIDVTRKLEQASYVWDKVFADKKIEEIEKINIDNFTSYREYYAAIQELVYKNEEKYKLLLGEENLFDLQMLLYSLSTDFEKYDNDMIVRERVIIQMLEKLMDEYKEEKFFGQMGAFHSSQRYHLKENDAYTCAEYLNKYSTIAKNQVVSIIYNYTNSYYYGGNAIRLINKTYPEILYPDKGTYTLIDLSEKNNPLADLYLPWQENRLSDTLQYIIHIKDKEAIKKYKQ